MLYCDVIIIQLFAAFPICRLHVYDAAASAPAQPFLTTRADTAGAPLAGQPGRWQLAEVEGQDSPAAQMAQWQALVQGVRELSSTWVGGAQHGASAHATLVKYEKVQHQTPVVAAQAQRHWMNWLLMLCESLIR